MATGDCLIPLPTISSARVLPSVTCSSQHRHLGYGNRSKEPLACQVLHWAWFPDPSAMASKVSHFSAFSILIWLGGSYGYWSSIDEVFTRIQTGSGGRGRRGQILSHHSTHTEPFCGRVRSNHWGYALSLTVLSHSDWLTFLPKTHIESNALLMVKLPCSMCLIQLDKRNTQPCENNICGRAKVSFWSTQSTRDKASKKF